MVLGEKRTGKKRTGNKSTGKKRTRKIAHAEKSARGKKRIRKKSADTIILTDHNFCLQCNFCLK